MSRQAFRSPTLSIGNLLIAKEIGISGGDFLKGDGTGSFSIYGDKFPVRSSAVVVSFSQKKTKTNANARYIDI